jgi:hypothetical protein
MMKPLLNPNSRRPGPAAVLLGGLCLVLALPTGYVRAEEPDAGDEAQPVKTVKVTDVEPGSEAPAPDAQAPGDVSAEETDPADMSLHGGEDGTVLESLTIEGEDRIQIEFDRPELALAIDGYEVGGLEWGRNMDVVQRREVDAFRPMVATSGDELGLATGRPWLNRLRTGSVARFKPELKDVERWQLTIADSRGDTVRVFSGKGSPPKSIEWDGVCSDGDLAIPGRTYSYVLDASDKAGNRRNFVGPGFEVAPYRIARKGRVDILISGETLLGPDAAARPKGVDDPWLLEAASWCAQYASAEAPIEIAVTARNHDLAEAMGEIAREALAAHLPGPRARLRVTTSASSEAPAHGVLRISAAE